MFSKPEMKNKQTKKMPHVCMPLTTKSNTVSQEWKVSGYQQCGGIKKALLFVDLDVL